MENCLKDYVGVKWCGNTQMPLSGFFINQLPGISLESIEKTAEKEQKNFLGVWEDVQARAWLRLYKDVKVNLRKRHKLLTKMAPIDFNAELIDTIIAPEALYKGFVLQVDNQVFTSIYISSLKITFPADESVVFNFFSEGVLIHSQTELVTTGANTIKINKTFGNEVFVCFDATMLSTYSSTKDGDCYCECKEFDDCKIRMFGATAELSHPEDINSSTDFFGITEICASMHCDYSSIICCFKDEFIDTWMNLLGAELMIERRFSSRLNRFTTIDKEAAAELLDYYTAEYEKSLNETIKGIQVQENNCCIVCNPLLVSKHTLP
ncbi:MAG: hypothetical protein K1X55_17490 [Chitinophagales bacterium]|nr:hypothetical protein [Chitinophagales bacterium]